MLQIEPIGIDSLLLFICNAFKGDEKLCNKFHINSPTYYEDAALDSYNRILELVKENTYGETGVFGIKKDDVRIGFIIAVKGANLLYSFGINISYRTPEIKKEFINFVKDYLGTKIKVFLYRKNTKAIQFLLNNNFKEVGQLQDNNEPVIQFELCQ